MAAGFVESGRQADIFAPLFHVTKANYVFCLKEPVLLHFVFTLLKYVSLGLFIWLMGAVFFGDGTEFANRSDPAQLRVLDVQAQRQTDGSIRFRPVFTLNDAGAAAPTYAGDIWERSATHRAGDVVSGQYDPRTGEMRSNQMQGYSLWLGRIAKWFGILVALQAVALLFGFPEQSLPLRIRVVAFHRPRRIWN